MTVRIRQATDADARGVRLLFARTFGTELSEAEWQWKFADDPDGWFAVVAEDAGAIVGNYAGWGMRFRLDGEEKTLFSVGDVATDRAARGLGRGVYRDMAHDFYEAVGARGVPFCFGFPNARALAISHRLVGSKTLFPIREIAVPVGDFAAPPPDAAAGDAVGPAFDALWDSARASVATGAVRDRRRVNWRFHARPTRYYRMVWTGAETMRAWCVLSVVGERALVADFLARDGRTDLFSEVFAAAAAEAGRLGARRLVFWESPGGPAAALLASLSGERGEAGFPLIVRPIEEGAAERFARSVHLVPSLYDVV